MNQAIRLAVLVAMTWLCHATLGAQSAARLVEVQRIVGAEQDLSLVGLAARGSDGTIWISQPQDMNVVAFSPSGVKVRTIGRRGEGPGAFGGPPAGLIPSEDGLMVFDQQLQRITRFGRPGLGVATTPVVRPGALSGSSPAILMSAGPEYAFYISVNRSRLVGGSRDGAPDRVEIHVGAIDGSTHRLLAASDYHSCGMGVRTGTSQRQIAIPFCHGTFRGVSPEGRTVAIAEPVELGAGQTAVDVRIYSVTGALLSRSRHALGPSIIPKPSVDSRVARLRERYKDPEGSAILDAIIKSGLIPQTYPPVAAVTVSDDGEAWVTTRSGPQGTRGVLVIRPDGSLRGRASLAPGTRIGWASDGHALVVEETPDGLQDVVLYRLEGQ
ncbi:MAG: hypothetical protein U0974_11365 [Gemmatimonadales bacterium]|nr:hypothetical protein [Gemmatimonadales bacterium]MDZ4390312.1 hypothetical protein [Gemmatimonadales bacterium]